MARRAEEFPVRYEGKRATLSFGESAVRLFGRKSFALFHSFPDPTALEVRVDGDALVITDGIETISVGEDGVPLDQVAAGFDVSSRPLRSKVQIPIATAPFIAGREIVETLGVVSGSSTVSSEAFGSLRRGAGASSGRVERYEQDLSTARRMAFAGMREQAHMGGADAVISVTVSHDTVGFDADFVLVTAVGTAVRLDPPISSY